VGRHSGQGGEGVVAALAFDGLAVVRVAHPSPDVGQLEGLAELGVAVLGGGDGEQQAMLPGALLRVLGVAAHELAVDLGALAVLAAGEVGEGEALEQGDGAALGGGRGGGEAREQVERVLRAAGGGEGVDEAVVGGLQGVVGRSGSRSRWRG
jgi:hypothetical protein